MTDNERLAFAAGLFFGALLGTVHWWGPLVRLWAERWP
jgi:hypothetical protein